MNLKVLLPEAAVQEQIAEVAVALGPGQSAEWRGEATAQIEGVVRLALEAAVAEIRQLKTEVRRESTRADRWMRIATTQGH